MRLAIREIRRLRIGLEPTNWLALGLGSRLARGSRLQLAATGCNRLHCAQLQPARSIGVLSVGLRCVVLCRVVSCCFALFRVALRCGQTVSRRALPAVTRSRVANCSAATNCSQSSHLSAMSASNSFARFAWLASLSADWRLLRLESARVCVTVRLCVCV